MTAWSAFVIALFLIIRRNNIQVPDIPKSIQQILLNFENNLISTAIIQVQKIANIQLKLKWTNNMQKKYEI